MATQTAPNAEIVLRLPMTYSLRICVNFPPILSGISSNLEPFNVKKVECYIIHLAIINASCVFSIINTSIT